MSAAIEIGLRKTGLLVGVKAIEIRLDGTVVDQIGFGETRTIPCPPGEHRLELVLRALFFSRRSNALTVAVPVDGVLKVAARYSRMWGTLRLGTAKDG